MLTHIPLAPLSPSHPVARQEGEKRPLPLPAEAVKNPRVSMPPLYGLVQGTEKATFLFKWCSLQDGGASFSLGL